MFEEAFYENKNLNLQLRETQAVPTTALPEGVDPEHLLKVLTRGLHC